MSKVLLVEDDDSTLFMVSSALAGAGYSVETAATGEDGQYLLLNFHYDLAILDWDLPTLSGMDILNAYRQSGGKTPVLFLTGRDCLDSIEQGLDSGADDYLVKPFAFRELLSRVRALLRRSSDQKTALLSCGQITLDSTSGVVTAYGSEVRLTPQDQALLEFLIRHPNQLFTTEALLARVWNSDSSAAGSAVRTSFLRLRKALSSQGHPAPIVNIRGQGYKIVADGSPEPAAQSLE